MLFALEVRRAPRAFDQKKAVKAAKFILGEHDIESGEVRVGILFVSKEKIRSLNHKWRKKDLPTDVLSFFNYEKVPMRHEHFLDLGDIYICSAVARGQAGQHELSFGEELLLLYVHGFLHLLGHDHELAVDERKMFRLQEKILSSIGVRYNPKLIQ